MENFFQHFRKTIKHWYIPLIIGVLLIILGIYVFTTPMETYMTLTIIFSVSFVASGLLDIIFSIQNNKILKGWGWYLVGGILSLAMGIYLVVYPAISMVVLPFVVGFTLLFRSFQLLGFAFDLKESKVLNWGNLAILSIVGVIFSFLLLSNPVFTGISIVALTALSFIFVGISSIVLSFNLKKMKNIPEKISPELKERIDAIQEELDEQMRKQ